jgi:hypothetical protein
MLILPQICLTVPLVSTVQLDHPQGIHIKPRLQSLVQLTMVHAQLDTIAQQQQNQLLLILVLQVLSQTKSEQLQKITVWFVHQDSSVKLPVSINLTDQLQSEPGLVMVFWLICNVTHLVLIRSAHLVHLSLNSVQQAITKTLPIKASVLSVM